MKFFSIILSFFGGGLPLKTLVVGTRGLFWRELFFSIKTFAENKSASVIFYLLLGEPPSSLKFFQKLKMVFLYFYLLLRGILSPPHLTQIWCLETHGLVFGKLLYFPIYLNLKLVRKYKMRSYYFIFRWGRFITPRLTVGFWRSKDYSWRKSLLFSLFAEIAIYWWPRREFVNEMTAAAASITD